MILSCGIVMYSMSYVGVICELSTSGLTLRLSRLDVSSAPIMLFIRAIECFCYGLFRCGKIMFELTHSSLASDSSTFETYVALMCAPM